MKPEVDQSNPMTEYLKNIVKEEIRNHIQQISIEQLQKKDEEIYLSPKEAAAYLKRNVITLYRLRKRGVLPFHKFGRKVLFKKSDLDTFYNQNYSK